MRFAGWFGLSVGLLMLGQWAFFLLDPRNPQRSRLKLPTTHGGFAYLTFGTLVLGLAVASMFF